MRIKIIALSFLMTLAGGAVAPLTAQSLADIARLEEARRKAIRAPAKVITNTDLKPVLPPESAPAPATAAPAAPGGAPDAAATPAAPASPDAAQTAGAAAPTEPVKDQAYWSGRIQGLRAQVERDQALAEAVQVQVSSLTADLANRDSAQTTVIANNRTKALAELDRLQKAVTDGRKAIADLEEEARRSGVPPGWLR